MTRITLKNILGKKDGAASLITSLIDQLQTSVSIVDDAGKVLLGTEQGCADFQYSLIINDEVIGYVKGDDKAGVVKDLLTHLLEKEYEKRKLGSEVLNLYQEVNLMFNFSDKLAKTIEAPAISMVTLKEARHLIKSNSGVVVLWDDQNQKLQVVASSGDIFFYPETISTEFEQLREIILSGRSEIISDVPMLIQAGIVLPEVKSIIYSALKVQHRVMGAIILATNEFIQYTASDLKLLTTLALQSSSAIESALLYEKNISEAKEREDAMRRVYEITAKFVPYEFIGSLGHKYITDVKLGDQVERVVTVLFSDIRDFTTLSEQMTPEENFSFVCSFNERIGPIIRNHNGFINQYLGDAIMAIFPENASDALAAAVEMQFAVQEFNSERQLKNQPSIQIGVGMHTGPLIMGITGDKERMDATTISDTVNTASRIENVTKQFKAGIILSDATIKEIKNKENFLFRYLGPVQLKGKHAPIDIHECFSGNSEPELKKKLDTLSAFNEGVSLFLNKHYTEASNTFQKVLDAHPSDRTANFLYNNTKQYIDLEISNKNMVGI